MTEKNKYMEMMQRYFEAETTLSEERELAAYAAASKDPEFELVCAVLGYLSIGRAKRTRRAGGWAVGVAAASLAAVVTAGIAFFHPGARSVQYAFSEKSTDERQIMQTVETSLSEFFSRESGVEVQLAEILNR